MKRQAVGRAICGDLRKRTTQGAHVSAWFEAHILPDTNFRRRSFRPFCGFRAPDPQEEWVKHTQEAGCTLEAVVGALEEQLCCLSTGKNIAYMRYESLFRNHQVHSDLTARGVGV